MFLCLWNNHLNLRDMFILGNTCTLLRRLPCWYLSLYIYSQTSLFKQKDFSKGKKNKIKQRSAFLFHHYITVYVCTLIFRNKNREKTPRYQLNKCPSIEYCYSLSQFEKFIERASLVIQLVWENNQRNLAMLKINRYCIFHLPKKTRSV